MITPSLTTVTAPVTEIGRTAVNLIDNLGHGVEPKSLITRLNGSLVVRASTGPVPSPG